MSGDVFVTGDLVPGGNMRRRENIAVMRISPLREPADVGGGLVEGFENESAMGGCGMRSTRIGADDSGWSISLLITNATYALSRAKFDEL